MSYKIGFPGMTKFQQSYGGKALSSSPGIVPFKKNIGPLDIRPDNSVTKKIFKK